MDWGAVVVPAMSTVFTAITLFFLRWVWIQIQRNLNEGRKETASLIDSIKNDNKAQLDRIEAQVNKTNGTVREHSSELNDMERRLVAQETSTNLLVRLFVSEPRLSAPTTLPRADTTPSP